MNKLLIVTVLCITAISGMTGRIEALEFIENEKIMDTYKLETERMAVFKDGYGLVVKRLKGTSDRQGQLAITDVPENAVLGSFWAVAEDNKLLSIKAEEIGITSIKNGESRCTSYLDILESNKGKQCTVYTHDDKSYAGIISEVLVEENTSYLNGELFVLESDSRQYILPVSGVKNLKIDNAVYKRKWETSETLKQKRLVFNFEKANAEQDVRIFYFTPGMRWVPSYRLMINEKTGKAEISLQAEFINNLEDIDKTKVELVVGAPNIKFRNIKSPLSLEMMLAGTLNQINSDESMMGNNVLSNAVFSQMVAEESYQREAPAAGAGPGSSDFLPADSVQDFYIFSLEKINLAKGSVLAVPLFTVEAAYRDVYVWNMKVIQNASGDADPYAKNEVWHYIELQNDSKWPWTTGPAMIMQGFVPIGQDLLKYTAMGNKVRIPLSIATDVHASWKMSESGRKENAVRINRQYYTKIDKNIELTVRNYSGKSRDLEIITDTGGKVEKADREGVIVIDSFHPDDWNNYYQMQVNNHSTVTWKTRLKAGKEYHSGCSFYFYEK